MKLGYALVYVHDVPGTIAFYERAFAMQRRFIHESGQYGEMETGATALSFASEAMAEANGIAIRPNRPRDLASGFELCLIVSDPQEAFDRAVAAGAAPVRPPEQKPWGQTVAYVRDLNGCLVELCTEVAS